MPSSWGVWRHLPHVVRACLIGLLVAAVGELPWVLLAQVNVRISPSVPWAVVVMGLWLFAYWKYMSGAGWPRTTRATRVESFRSRRITKQTWQWALMGGGLAVLSLIALELLALRLVQAPVDQSAARPAIPLYSLLPLAVMSAIASAIPEEIGLRGYMQAPLERGYHPAFAIGFVAVVFGLAHMSHGLSVFLLFDFAFGLVYGVLAFYANSLLPGVVLHCGFNVVLFVGGRHIAAVIAARPALWNSGMNFWFWICCAAFVLLGAYATYAFRKLARISGRCWRLRPVE
jgi:membrane protease YdiL (CAAX protease family)